MLGSIRHEALRRGEGRRQRACLKRSVHCAGGAAFALHLLDNGHVAPDVFDPQSRTKGAEIIVPDNGICERFHRTVLKEFYRVAFRKKIYRAIEELQADLDAWLLEYNERRPHQGRWCFGADLP
jgi:transposase InsO family protein